MKWPRGRYNGQRIEGFKVSFSLRVLSLREFIRPHIAWNFGEPCIIWLFFAIRAKLEFEASRPPKEDFTNGYESRYK